MGPNIGRRASLPINGGGRLWPQREIKRPHHRSNRKKARAAHGCPLELSDQLRTHVAGKARRRPAEQPATDKPAEPPADSASPVAAKSGKRKFVMMGVLGLLALAAVGYGSYCFLVGRFYISTDDAYVRANNTTLGARVSGHVAAILPGDNSIVRADGDFQDRRWRLPHRSRCRAQQKIATQQATIERISRQVTALKRDRADKAQLVSAEKPRWKRARLDFERQQALSTRASPRARPSKFPKPGRDQGAAAVKSAQAAYDASRDNVEVTKAQQAEARARLAGLQTSLAKAERDLDFTSVQAPVGGGTFSNRIANTGDFIQGRTAARQRGAAQRRLHRRQLQETKAQAHPPRPAGDDQG